MDIETIEFKGVVYPVRWVRITDEYDEIQDVLVATDALQQALLLPSGEFVSKEAEEIDERLFCYVAPEALEMPDDVLASLVERDCYDVPEEVIHAGKDTISLNRETVFALMRTALRGRGNLWDDAACMFHFIEKDGTAAEQKVAKDEMRRLDEIVHGSAGWDKPTLLNAALAYQVVLRIHDEMRQRVESRPRRKGA